MNWIELKSGKYPNSIWVELKKVILSALILTFLLFILVVTSSVAQQRIVGVNVDDWFKYGDLATTWNSNDPNASFPPPGSEGLKTLNETEWMSISITSIPGTNITFQTLMHYKNGTEETIPGSIDIETGENVEGQFSAISANLNPNDTVYDSYEWYGFYRINETQVRNYPDQAREINHLNITFEFSFIESYRYVSVNYYWDRSTGILVESSAEFINQTGEYTTTWSQITRMTESNVWAIPEFATSTSMLLLLAVLLVTIVVHKRRQMETSLPMHV